MIFLYIVIAVILLSWSLLTVQMLFNFRDVMDKMTFTIFTISLFVYGACCYAALEQIKLLCGN